MHWANDLVIWVSPLCTAGELATFPPFLATCQPWGRSAWVSIKSRARCSSEEGTGGELGGRGGVG